MLESPSLTSVFLKTLLLEPHLVDNSGILTMGMYVISLMACLENPEAAGITSGTADFVR